MYMIPRRRALAAGVPSGPGAVTQSTKAWASARSAGFFQSTIQSTARPSLCSEMLSWSQARVMPMTALP